MNNFPTLREWAGWFGGGAAPSKPPLINLFSYEPLAEEHHRHDSSTSDRLCSVRDCRSHYTWTKQPNPDVNGGHGRSAAWTARPVWRRHWDGTHDVPGCLRARESHSREPGDFTGA